MTTDYVRDHPRNHPSPKKLTQASASENPKPEKPFRNPRIHNDLISLYAMFFKVHKNMNKYLRITILEQEVMNAISLTMRLTIEVNTARKLAAGGSTDMIKITSQMIAHMENIKAFTHLLWKLKAITDGFFTQVAAKTDEIAKQIHGWQKFLLAK